MEILSLKENDIVLEKFIDHLNKGKDINFNTKAVDGKIIGTGRPDFTQDVTGYKLIYKDKPFILYDVPGIEGNEKNYEEIIQKAVNKAHLIFYVNGTSKKPEPGTAEKLKKYLRNYTSVYSIINLHCKPKKNREIEIDGTYSDELSKKFQEQLTSIKPQTEDVLKRILGDNFKKTVILNGLEAFSAYSYDEKNQESTIFIDKEKGLEKTQEKYFNEYNAFPSPIKQMKIDSCINEITDVIDSHADNFKPFIIETNKKKLIARLDSSLEIISEVETEANKMCKELIEGYKEFKSKSKEAEKNFCDYMEYSYISNAVSPVINKQFDEFRKIIEYKEGKIKKYDYESFFDEDKNEEIKKNIQKQLKTDYKIQVEYFESNIKKATKRFSEDLENIFKFSEVIFPNLDLNLSGIEKEMGEILKDVGGKLFKIGGFALGGLFLGIPGVVIGTILGLISVVIDFFLFKNARISKAKEKAKKVFSEIERKLCNDLESNFTVEGYTSNISDITRNIVNKCEQEIEKYEKLQISLKNLTKSIKHKINTLKEKKYGTL